MSRYKKQIRPQFSKYRFQNESALAHSLWAHADSIWCRYSENCGRICFFLRLIILLTDPILSHSPDFGRPKQGQNCQTAQQPLFAKKAFGPLRIYIIWPFMAHPIISFRFRVIARSIKKFHSSLIFCFCLQKNAAGPGTLKLRISEKLSLFFGHFWAFLSLEVDSDQF